MHTYVENALQNTMEKGCTTRGNKTKSENNKIALNSHEILEAFKVKLPTKTVSIFGISTFNMVIIGALLCYMNTFNTHTHSGTHTYIKHNWMRRNERTGKR